MVQFIKFIWELPQNILGMLVWLYYRRRITETEIINGRYFYCVKDFGVSLGSFIFWFKESTDSIKAHEYGHSVQSLIFGPLYLILVGIPSVLRVGYRSIYLRLTGTRWSNYRKGYPERWADELGVKYFRK